jgi:hypothetical protein
MATNYTRTDAVATTQTHAEKMVSALEASLLANPGVANFAVDGMSMTYNRQQALEELKYWKRSVGRADNTRPLKLKLTLS